jgi:hypothetical protein
MLKLEAGKAWGRLGTAPILSILQNAISTLIDN